MSNSPITTRVITTAQTVVVDGTFAALGLGAYAADLLKDRPSKDDVSAQLESLRRDPKHQLAEGFVALTSRGRELFGQARTTATESTQAATRETASVINLREIEEDAADLAETVDEAVADTAQRVSETVADATDEVVDAADTAADKAAMAGLPDDLSTLTVAELKDVASQLEIDGRSSMKKAQLIQAIEGARN